MNFQNYNILKIKYDKKNIQLLKKASLKCLILDNFNSEHMKINLKINFKL